MEQYILVSVLRACMSNLNVSVDVLNELEGVIHDNSVTLLDVNRVSAALDLLLNWMVSCGFGYDNIPEEYERYKDMVDGMPYTEGLRYIIMREVENTHTDGDANETD